ncbi:MAG TPA: class I SAM-dependent methyltransferase [Devosia sp.]|nr:class I SAM-dependent methyltransferase [Devosia sp.]
MDQDSPSRTAMAAAMHRAAHQRLERGAIFADPLAVPILDAAARDRLDDWAALPRRRGMRLFIAARHRFAEERLAAAVATGIRQIVVLGAGLDTTALRGLHGERGVRYFEVDHPATQAWKRRRIAEAGLPAPAELTFAPVDFERQTLGDGLAAAGFDPLLPAFFVWLGVVPYLTEAAIFETLRFVAQVPRAEIVFDYANPPDQLEPAVRAAHEARAANVAAIGEPWLSYFDSADLAARLAALGAAELDDLGPVEIQRRIFRRPDPIPTRSGGHILWTRWD